jgi:hypothetical protein
LVNSSEFLAKTKRRKEIMDKPIPKEYKINWRDCDEIAKVSALKSTGYETIDPTRVYNITGRELLQILETSATIALIKSGVRE